MIVAGLVLIFIVYLISFVTHCSNASQANWGSCWLNLLDGAFRLYARRVHHFDPVVMELSKTQGVILASNHLSGLDPTLVCAAVDRPVRFLIAREQYDRKTLHWFFKWIGCIPVDRGSHPDKAFYAAHQALQKGEVIGMFPQGHIQIPGVDKLSLKRGVFLLALMAKVAILPVRLSGIAGTGLIVSALWTPSKHARIEIGEAMHVSEANRDQLKNELAAFMFKND